MLLFDPEYIEYTGVVGDNADENWGNGRERALALDTYKSMATSATSNCIFLLVSASHV